MIKIIHAADIHLDSPFSLLDIQKAQIRRLELRDSFRELMELASTSKADFLLIAGDLFDSEFFTHESAQMLIDCFKKSEKTNIIIAPGNHDPYTETSVYKKLDFPKNVYVFDKHEVSSFDFPSLNTTVYGFAFTSKEYTDRAFAKIKPVDKSRINIMVCHGELTSSYSTNAPITEADIENSDFDYVALGHIHNTSGIKKAKSGTYYGYCGALEGRGFDETGEMGVYSALMEKEEQKLSFNHRFIPFSKRIYLKHKLDITGFNDTASVIAKINALISTNNYDTKYALEIKLCGMTSPEFKIYPHYISDKIKSLFALKITDCTLPLYDFDKLENDVSVKGALFKKLRPMLEGENEEDREVASLALKYGISALSGGEVSDIF